MGNKNIFEYNRAAWNQASKYHQKARKNSLLKGFENPEFTTFTSDYDDIVINKLKHINFDGKTIAQLQCQNGRELLSLMKFGAKEATGFDISDIAISEAEQLAETAKLNAKFVRVNVLEIDDKYNDYFDFIYVLSRLLKKGGQILRKKTIV
jgi:2-polyprenyl-3-methyl-5-hydroxy-6-metoxy-1,4-benzoquinol methylase